MLWELDGIDLDEAQTEQDAVRISWDGESRSLRDLPFLGVPHDLGALDVEKA